MRKRGRKIRRGGRRKKEEKKKKKKKRRLEIKKMEKTE
jgi:hypothetical protein